MKKKILMATFIFLSGFILSGIAYYLIKSPILITAAITFGTTFYHFAMRLIVAFILNTCFRNRMDPTKKWFQEKRFESEFYKKIRVKQWKKRLPTFHPEDFLIEKHSAADIIQATCQAEIVHEVIMAFSLVPISFSVWFGAAEVFLLTSWAAFLFDGAFVIVQRYNRPRFRMLMKKFSKKREDVKQ